METPSSTAWSQRLVNYSIGTVIGIVLVAIAWVPVREAVLWLANLPEVEHAFRDPVYGRQDAMISLGSFLLLSPLAVLLILWALAFIYALPAGVLLPLGRRVGIPEWISSIIVIAFSATVVYTQSSLWLSPCLWGLGLLARACLTVLQ
jgi:hypothetical protein